MSRVTRSSQSKLFHWIASLGLAALMLAGAGPVAARGGAQLAPAPSSADVGGGLPLVARAGADLARGGPVVNTSDRSAVVSFYREWYVPGRAAGIGWTGSYVSCSSGSVSASYRAATAGRINYFRAMAGVPADVVLDDSVSLGSQQDAAFLQSANNALDHHPPSSWACFSTPGYYAAATSLLALGGSGPAAMDMYIQEGGDNNFAVGHRRWMLFPQTRAMASGDTPEGSGHQAANALRAADTHYIDPRPDVRDGFVAWPPPGFVPHSVVYPRWSVGLTSANFDSAQVSMRRNGVSIAVRREPVDTGYAENAVAWAPLGMASWDRWPLPSGDDNYDVTVTGVTLNGAALNFVYRVTVIPAPDSATDLALSQNHIKENSPAGTPIGAVTGADGTLGPAYSVALVQGANDNAWFAMSGQTLVTAAPLDYEVRADYTVRLRAQVAGGPLMERSLAVHVDNVNEAPSAPVMLGGTLAENQPPGTAAGVLAASDPDAGDTLSYQLVAGPGDQDNARFMVDGATVRARNSLDYEARPSYSVRIAAVDAGGLSTAASMSLTVINMDEPPAIMAPSSVFITPSANVSLTVSAIDPEHAGASLDATSAPAWLVARRESSSTLAFHGISASAPGSYDLSLLAHDANGNATLRTITFRVSTIVASAYLPVVTLAP